MMHFIVNKKSRSGNGANIWKSLRDYLQKKHIRYREWQTQYQGHAAELASHICNLKEDDITIVVVGGDGTANEVINGMTSFDKVKFAIIPVGSGNDLARGLGIKGEPVDILKRILKSRTERRIDLGRVMWNGGNQSKLYAISAGVGLDALVCKKAITSPVKKVLNKIHLGKLTYLILTVQSVFTMRTADIKMKIDEHSMEFDKAIFAAVMNFKAEGGGVPMAPRADAGDGMLSVCAANGVPKWKIFFLLPILVMAKHENIRAFTTVNCKKAELSINTPFTLHADGEYLADVTEVTFECIPGILNVVV